MSKAITKEDMAFLKEASERPGETMVVWPSALSTSTSSAKPL
jgi:hypothetical protein